MSDQLANRLRKVLAARGIDKEVPDNFSEQIGKALKRNVGLTKNMGLTRDEVMRNMELSQLKDIDHHEYVKAVRAIFKAHLTKSIANGTLYQEKNGRWRKKENYRLTGIEEIDAILDRSCGCQNAPTE